MYLKRVRRVTKGGCLHSQPGGYYLQGNTGDGPGEAGQAGWETCCTHACEWGGRGSAPASCGGKGRQVQVQCCHVFRFFQKNWEFRFSVKVPFLFTCLQASVASSVKGNDSSQTQDRCEDWKAYIFQVSTRMLSSLPQAQDWVKDV